MRTLSGLWLPGQDPDALLLPSLDYVREGEPIVRFRSLQDPEFRKRIHRSRWRDETGASPAPSGAGRLMKALAAEFPHFTAGAAGWVATAPTTFGATTARVFPFSMDGAVYTAKIHFHTVGAVATSFQFGIFDGSAGAAGLVYTSGAQGTAANHTTITPTNPIFLAAGLTYYFAMTNNNSASATTAYYLSAALAAASMPRWGTVAATAGAMPGSLSVAGITMTVGGWPIYVELSAA